MHKFKPGQIYNFLMIDDIKHFSIYLLTSSISSFEHFLKDIFLPILKWICIELFEYLALLTNDASFSLFVPHLYA